MMSSYTFVFSSSCCAKGRGQWLSQVVSDFSSVYFLSALKSPTFVFVFFVFRGKCRR